MTSTASAPSIKHKTFRYATRVDWLGGRAGNLSSGDEKRPFRVSSPPEFKGEEGTWTPEDLLVAAANACTMTTFAAISSKLQLPVVSYTSQAEGTLEFADGGFLFTQMVIRPNIVVSDESAVEPALQAIRDAHRNCLISRSLRAEVQLEPRVEVAPQ